MRKHLSLFVVLLAQFAAASLSQADPKTVRLAAVNTPVFSGLLQDLIQGFEAQSGYKVELYGGSDVYERGKAGEADIIISHYGKSPVERFVLDGYGLWPRTVFSNQAAIIGPKSDPAGIRGLSSASEAFAKIAAAKAPFVANDLAGVRYLTEILWEKAGRPDRSGWFIEEGAAKGRAVKLAEEKQGYVIFGALPFLRFKEKNNSSMEILVDGDPILQRVMACVLINPAKISGINAEGARALQNYLLSPAIQARIAAYRTPGSNVQLWWPAGRNNSNVSDEAESPTE